MFSPPQVQTINDQRPPIPLHTARITNSFVGHQHMQVQNKESDGITITPCNFCTPDNPTNHVLTRASEQACPTSRMHRHQRPADPIFRVRPTHTTMSYAGSRSFLYSFPSIRRNTIVLTVHAQANLLCSRYVPHMQCQHPMF